MMMMMIMMENIIRQSASQLVNKCVDERRNE